MRFVGTHFLISCTLSSSGNLMRREPATCTRDVTDPHRVPGLVLQLRASVSTSGSGDQNIRAQGHSEVHMKVQGVNVPRNC